MSQEYFRSKGKSHDNEDNGHFDDNSDDLDFRTAVSSFPPGRPSSPPSASSALGMMTVGTGSASQHVARLQSMLQPDNDSGYGDSIAGDMAALEDHPGAADSSDRRAQAAALHQLWYNKHRVILGRAINSAIELLKGLQEMNVAWPAHYPSVQRAELDSPSRPAASRPGLGHTQSTFDDTAAYPQSSSSSSAQPPPMRRAMTSLDDAQAESSSMAAERRPVAEPRLVTPQIAQEFSILKLDLKLGGLNQVELVHSLEKGSIASLLDGKVSSSIKHLLSLQERIADTASKVLVTGDLNAGKSTFCNALLRRKVLPEDQQPCTSIFCEVLDARENSGIEEVHAVHKDMVYSRNDETTYDVFPLSDLEKIVTDNITYTQCKVYVADSRNDDESLLSNGVVDIALIDAPGLNMDTTKTTAIFARQEEIDVVVFVVSATNHFTQTATEFIRAAAAEKAYLFMVINGFDTIRDKGRCTKMILNQVRGLSPATYKESAELVHFVSSNAIPMASPLDAMVVAGSGGASGGGGGGDDHDDDDPKGKGKDKEKIRDFTNLEQSLRRFVLEKRARSKLAPAKTYLMNILNDVNVLATVNTDMAQAELDRVSRQLRELEPQLEASRKAKTEVSDEIDQTIERTCTDMYDYSRKTISSAIALAGENTHDVPYPGLFGAFEYAEELKEVMLSQIAASVKECEDHARVRTVASVNAIKQLGILHLGNDYADMSFRPDVMFRRKRDMLARQVDIPTQLWDFIDWSTLMQREEKAGMALTVAGVVGTGVISSYGQVNLALRAAQLLGVESVRRLIVPGVVVAAAAAVFFVLNQIPHSLPHRLSSKISEQLAAMDYVHANSSRISGSLRKVLRFPADALRVNLGQSLEKLERQRADTARVRAESDVALKYFGNLTRVSAQQHRMIRAVDLEGHPPALR